MTPTIASVLNLIGPDAAIIFLIVLLLFGAKKVPELARAMGRAVREFSAGRDEIERELTQSEAGEATKPKLLNGKAKLQPAHSSLRCPTSCRGCPSVAWLQKETE
jgi:sec-independent protein translocase protein TatA